MIYVYVIKSRIKKYRYVGITDNLEQRLKQHNAGYSLATKPYAPFGILIVEQYQNYKRARQREKFLKSGQGRKYLDTLGK